MPEIWKLSTTAVNKFLRDCKIVSKVKIGQNKGIRFNYGETDWLLTETGDLFRYDLGDRLVHCPIGVVNRKGVMTHVYYFSVPKGYWSQRRREVVAKDLLWAAFGRCDLPACHKIVYKTQSTEDDLILPSTISIQNIDIRRKT